LRQRWGVIQGLNENICNPCGGYGRGQRNVRCWLSGLWWGKQGGRRWNWEVCGPQRWTSAGVEVRLEIRRFEPSVDGGGQGVAVAHADANPEYHGGAILWPFLALRQVPSFPRQGAPVKRYREYREYP